jgi:hypothetical protein
MASSLPGPKHPKNKCVQIGHVIDATGGRNALASNLARL